MKNMPKQRNPRILGEDLGDVAWGTGGLFGVAAANDKVVAPILKNVLPSVYASNMFGTIADSLSTFGVAYLGGWLMKSVSRRGGELTQFTGSVLAGARFLTAFVPGFYLSAEVPVSLAGVNLNLGGGNPADTKQLAAGNTVSPNASLYSTALDVGSPGAQAYNLKGGY